MVTQKNVLVACWEMPKPDTSAGDLRLVALLELMAKQHKVTLCVLEGVPKKLSIHQQKLKASGVRVLNRGKNSFHATTQRHIYNVVILEFWEFAEHFLPIVRQRQPWATILVDSIDVHFMREEAGLQFGLSDAATVATNKQRELSVYRSADAVIVVTTDDDQALAAAGGIPRRYLVPLILEQRERTVQQRKCEALFVGGFRHPPNIDAVLWLARDIWPKVVDALPEAALTIIGSNPPPSILQLSGHNHVDVVGYVPDTKPFLDTAMVSVAPLRYGAGMKGKVSEAMMAGLPVVTTSFGIQGLGVVPGEHALVANEAQDFARQVIALLCDSQQAYAVGLSGQAHIASICGMPAAKVYLGRMFADISKRTIVFTPRWIAQVAMNYAKSFAQVEFDYVKRVIKRATRTLLNKTPFKHAGPSRSR